jgi:hypothetical protein
MVTDPKALNDCVKVISSKPYASRKGFLPTILITHLSCALGYNTSNEPGCTCITRVGTTTPALIARPAVKCVSGTCISTTRSATTRPLSGKHYAASSVRFFQRKIYEGAKTQFLHPHRSTPAPIKQPQWSYGNSQALISIFKD